MAKSIRLLLPEDVLGFLKDAGQIHLTSVPQHEGSSNANFNRAVHWITNCECALISACRHDEEITSKINSERTRELETALRQYGYGHCKVRGRYGEAGNKVSMENSFLVFNRTDQDTAFYERMFGLSRRFDQDSFIHKKAGSVEPAVLYKTNDAPDTENFFDDEGKRVLGTLNFDIQDDDYYSRIGSRRFKFAKAKELS